MSASDRANNSFFLVLEGIDGCGKTTLLEGLKAYFEEGDIEVYSTRATDGTPLGQDIRAIVQAAPKPQESAGYAIDSYAELLLLGAAHRQLAVELASVLSHNLVCLCDRYYYSSYVYQGIGRNIRRKDWHYIYDKIVRMPKPDLCLLVDIPAEVASERRQLRDGAGDRLEQDMAQKFATLRQGYLDLAQEHDEICVVDGNQTQQAVLDQAIAAIQSCLAKRLQNNQ